MSTAAVLAPAPVELAPIVDAVTVDGATSTIPIDDVLSAHAAVLKAAEDGNKVDKDALAKLLAVITEQTKDVVSHDLVLAHLVLLATFHQQLRGADEAKDLAYLCSAETRYFGFIEALGKAIARDASLIENPPLPPLDVAMRIFDAGRAFWAAQMPADMPFDLTVADVDETAVKGTIACASCRAEHTLAMPEYAAFRLHGKEHKCTSCAVSFTAEHLAVRRFLSKVARAPHLNTIGGTLQHPKTLEFVPKNGANMADLTKLFDKATWKQHAATLPALPTWRDVETKVLAPIMAATADSLTLPGNRRRFILVVSAHRDVTTGPWSMDLTTMKDAGSANAGCVRSGCLSPCASRCAGWIVAAGATKSAACYFTGDCIDGKIKSAACYDSGDSANNPVLLADGRAE
ncbi:hypothetical protein GGF31_006201 [Allomyces arbusculus]|nr:hypothetical protein GGF31_006201 [Allomyces arbusculus]